VYESAADLIVDTDERTPDELATDLAGQLA
jgi:hypothetical protein